MPGVAPDSDFPGQDLNTVTPRPSEPTATVPEPAAAGSRHAPDAIELELFTNRFAAVAGEMGERLRRTALSTNVRDRLDFSCAVLDREGRLVVNAPHIPVHLGALGLCVRRVRETCPLAPGDAVVTNHPGFGGSHLPDVTIVHAVGDDRGELLGYVASRAHHAELGGTRPGSMPPNARSLAEEGVVLPPTWLVRGGESRWQQLEALLSGGPHPSRAVAENLADLEAAVAANHQGVRGLQALARQHGAARVQHFMDRLRAQAREQAVRALEGFGSWHRTAEQRLDDGSPLRLDLRIADGRAVFDFRASGDVHPGNLNATPAIVRSAVLYALRATLDEPLPLNEGLLEPVTVLLRRGSLLDPEFPDDPRLAPAVVGGNVETSQRLVDTLFEALGLVACSQGTMNNLLFGNEHFGYYETVCGGAGAGPDFDGADAVHTHMTNTRITDPEILEWRYPVRLERFAIRRGSGGAGRHRGGDGVVRELRFLEPVALSILGQHRVEAPYGVDGGQPGAVGRQRLIRADGHEVELAGVDAADVEAGDRLILETPGGGGWGAPREVIEPGEIEPGETERGEVEP